MWQYTLYEYSPNIYHVDIPNFLKSTGFWPLFFQKNQLVIPHSASLIQDNECMRQSLLALIILASQKILWSNVQRRQRGGMLSATTSLMGQVWPIISWCNGYSCSNPLKVQIPMVFANGWSGTDHSLCDSAKSHANLSCFNQTHFNLSLLYTRGECPHGPSAILDWYFSTQVPETRKFHQDKIFFLRM